MREGERERDRDGEDRVLSECYLVYILYHWSFGRLYVFYQNSFHQTRHKKGPSSRFKNQGIQHGVCVCYS